MTNPFHHALVYFFMLFLLHAFGMSLFPIFALLLNILWVWHTATVPSACSLLQDPWRPFHLFLPVCPLYQLTKLRLNLSQPWRGPFSSPWSSDLPDLAFGSLSCSAGFVYLSGSLLFLSCLCLCTGHSLSRCPHKTGAPTFQVPTYPSHPPFHFLPHVQPICCIELGKQAIKNSYAKILH